jgi:hypothetical protein
MLDADKMCWKERNADEQARFISSYSNFESHHSQIDKTCLSRDTTVLFPRNYVYIIIIIIITLQSFVGPWPVFQFHNPMHSR